MTADRFEQPYPLQRLFLRYILPGLVCLLIISAVLTVLAARRLTEDVYLEQATRRAQVIDRAMAEVVPDHWRRLKNGDPPKSLYGDADGQKLLAALSREVHELDLVHLKIYAAGGVIQYATDASKIGTVDASTAYIAASERGASSVVHRVGSDGSVLYELYVLVAVPGRSPVVFELYEPVDHLNALLWRTGVAAAGVPGLILLALMVGMLRLVIVAQRDINSRPRSWPICARAWSGCSRARRLKRSSARSVSAGEFLRRERAALCCTRISATSRRFPRRMNLSGWSVS